MARKQNGFWSKALSVLGIEDTGNNEPEQVNEFSSDNYGRPNTYRPENKNPRRDTTVPKRHIPEKAGPSSQRYGETYPRYRRPEQTPPRRTHVSRFEDEPGYGYEEEMRPQRSRSAATARTVMLTLYNLRDANKVITALVNGNMIVVTLSTNDPDTTLRITDTLSGAVFALDATIRKASDNTYLLAPHTVNVKSAYETDDRF